MRNVVEELRQEHRNLAKLLNALEMQISIFADGRLPDYDVIQAIASYFLDYPDICHHPKEDLLAAKLLEKVGDEAANLRGLATQHEELGVLSRRFAHMVQRVLDEAELPRDEFVRSAGEFISSQRHHMQMEEKYFLPLAEKRLDAADIAELDAKIFSQSDPLFGPEVEELYKALSQSILKWEREDEEGPQT